MSSILVVRFIEMRALVNIIKYAFSDDAYLFMP